MHDLFRRATVFEFDSTFSALLLACFFFRSFSESECPDHHRRVRFELRQINIDFLVSLAAFGLVFIVARILELSPILRPLGLPKWVHKSIGTPDLSLWKIFVSKEFASEAKIKICLSSQKSVARHPVDAQMNASGISSKARSKHWLCASHSCSCFLNDKFLQKSPSPKFSGCSGPTNVHCACCMVAFIWQALHAQLWRHLMPACGTAEKWASVRFPLSAVLDGLMKSLWPRVASLVRALSPIPATSSKAELEPR